MPNGAKAKLDLPTLEAHFHLPMQEVAKKFGVCMTFFKKMCRQLGIKRWPYRKVSSPHPSEGPGVGQEGYSSTPRAL